jgi:hypothetical protein
MPQLLHLLVLDREHCAALATWHGARWLLPMLCCDERARAGSLIGRWAAGQGLSGDVVGQWLGRMTPDAPGIDWLVVITASPREPTPASALRWTPIESLTSSAPLLDYQQWAVAQATRGSGLPSVPGPFGALTWLDGVRQWLMDSAGVPDAGPVTPYRVSSHEVVLGIQTGHSRVYFKGLAPDRAIEARITSALSALAPEFFARTLALEWRADGTVWWLAEACPGLPLAQRLTACRARQVAVACAEIQRRVVSAPGGIARELPVLDLASAASWSAGLLEGGHLVPEDAAASCEAIERACHEIGAAGVPHSWIPLDLDPGNVLLDDDGAVRFIDLDDSFAGAAPLAMATYARRVTRLQIDRDRSVPWRQSLYGAYERTWPVAPLAAYEWRSFEIASAVLEGYLGWKRLVTNFERGEVQGPLEMASARIARRLARALTGHPARALT